MSAVDGKVAHPRTMRRTHKGEFTGLEPTGNEVEAMGVEINHVDKPCCLLSIRDSATWCDATR